MDASWMLETIYRSVILEIVDMANRPKYRNLSLPTEMVEEIERYINEHPEAGFVSIAEFIRFSVRAYLEFRDRLLENKEKDQEP